MCLQQRRAGPPLGLLLPLVLLGSAWLAGEGADAGAARGRGRTHSRLLDGDDALGSPGELAWQAWLRKDRSPTLTAAAHTGAGADVSSGGAGGGGVEVGAPRRLASRSIFVVQGTTTRRPPPPCGDGFRANSVGGCHMVIHVGVVATPAPAPSPAVAAADDAAAADLAAHEEEEEGSGAPPEDKMAARLRAFKAHGGGGGRRTISAWNDRKTIYSIMKESADAAAVASDSKRKSGRLRMLPTSSEQYRHMLPIIGGEQDQEIPFSQVRVRGID